MKNRCMQVLLGAMLGLLVVPAHAVAPIIQPTVAPQAAPKVVELADSAVVTYKKVSKLPTGPFDAQVRFSTQESAQDLKKQFAQRTMHATVSKNIIPGIKNFLEVAAEWIKELKAGSAVELTKTILLSLADDKESVVATVVLRRVGTGKEQKITATIMYVGLAHDEPMFLHNLFHAVFVRDASTLNLLKVLGFAAAGMAVVSGISKGVKGSWNPLALLGGDAQPAQSVFSTKEMDEFFDLLVKDIALEKTVHRCTFDDTDFDLSGLGRYSTVVARVTSADVLASDDFWVRLNDSKFIVLVVSKSVLKASPVSESLSRKKVSFFVFDDENDSSAYEAASDVGFFSSDFCSGVSSGFFFAKQQNPKTGIFCGCFDRVDNQFGHCVLDDFKTFFDKKDQVFEHEPSSSGDRCEEHGSGSGNFCGGAGVGASAAQGGVGGRRTVPPAQTPFVPERDFLSELSDALVAAGINMDKISLKQRSSAADTITGDAGKIAIIFDTVSYDPSLMLNAVSNGIVVSFCSSTEYYYAWYSCSNNYTKRNSIQFVNSFDEFVGCTGDGKYCITSIIKCLKENFSFVNGLEDIGAAEAAY